MTAPTEKDTANTAPAFSIAGGKSVTDVRASLDAGWDLLVQADGRIVAVGDSAGALRGVTLLRYASDGRLDTGFGDGGTVTVAVGARGDAGRAVALDSAGRILVAGVGTDAQRDDDVELMRFTAEGRLDTAFGNGGVATLDLGSGADRAFDLAVLGDGRILVAGSAAGAAPALAIARFDATGALDTAFGAGGVARLALAGLLPDEAALAVQDDGRVLLAGTLHDGGSGEDRAAVARFDAAGALDTSFDADGVALVDFTVEGSRAGAIAALDDGRILVAGAGRQGGAWDFAVARLDTAGGLDTAFGTAGRMLASFAAGDDVAHALALASDGGIVLAGSSFAGLPRKHDFALARLTSDGQIDNGFGTLGRVTTEIGDPRPDDATAIQIANWTDDAAQAVAVLPDGRLLALGTSANANGPDVALVRYGSDGRLDTTFAAGDGLQARVVQVEGGLPVTLAPALRAADAELDLAGNWANATLTIARAGGANPQDVFCARQTDFGGGSTGYPTATLGPLARVVQGFDLYLSGGPKLGNVVQNSNGTLTLQFVAAATPAKVDAILSQIAYWNTSDTPPQSVTLEWTLSDGNTGAQGTGGALAAHGTTVVEFVPVNDAPSFSAGTGKVRTAVTSPGADAPNAIALQADDKVLLAGYATPAGNRDFGLVRYDADGTIDTTFGGGDGIVTRPIGAADDTANAVAVDAAGRILVAGTTRTGTVDEFALLRFLPDGSPDTDFGGGDGIVTTRIGTTRAAGLSLALATDGSIYVAGDAVVAGFADFALARYRPDGSLDTAFGTGGVVTTAIGARDDNGVAVALDAEQRPVMVGHANTGSGVDLAVVRYTTAGALDTTFGGGDGIAIDAFTTGTENGRALAVLPDGRILVSAAWFEGPAASQSQGLALLRFAADGSIDTGFGDMGRVRAQPIYGDGTLGLQSDGSILLAGRVNGTTSSAAVVRYDSDGTLDTGFGALNGLVTTSVAGGFNYGRGPAVQSDGRIVLASYVNLPTAPDTFDFLLLGYDTDGSLDPAFGARSTLDGGARYTIGGPAVRLDADVQVWDAELDARGSYAGATLRLSRHGAASSDDVFSAVPGGRLGALAEGGELRLDGTAIGTVALNGGGVLELAFGAGATRDAVNAAMREIAYASRLAAAPADAVRIDWVFGDGNDGAQGAQGAKQASGSTTVTVAGPNLVQGTAGDDTLLGTDGIDSVLGQAGDDTLRGLEGNDTLLGGPGDDRLEGGAGDDSIDGGDGVDVAVFDAPRAQAALALAAGASGAGTVTGTGASAALGTDAFDGVERLKFADAVWALDTRAAGENVYDVVALLHCAFGATPPTSELARFLPLADDGVDAAAVGDAIIAHYLQGQPIPTEALVAFLWLQLTGTPAPAGVPESFAALVGPGLPFPTQGALYAAASMLELNTVRFAGLVADGLALPGDWYS